MNDFYQKRETTHRVTQGEDPTKSDPSDGHAPLYTLAFFLGLWPPVPLHLEAQPEGEASGIGFDLGPEL